MDTLATLEHAGFAAPARRGAPEDRRCQRHQGLLRAHYGVKKLVKHLSALIEEDAKPHLMNSINRTALEIAAVHSAGFLLDAALDAWRATLSNIDAQLKPFEDAEDAEEIAYDAGRAS